MKDLYRIPCASEDYYGTQVRTLSGRSLREVAFPLGGIGTGCISLGGRGQLRDWEIFGRPNKGFRPEFTFATLRVHPAGGQPAAKVVESPPLPPFRGSHGSQRNNGEGLPHFSSNTFRGEYPLARLEFNDPELPMSVELEAFNPFIPLEPADSGLPVAVLTYKLTNTGDRPADCLLTWTMQNVIAYDRCGEPDRADFGGNRNLFRSAEGLNGILMDSTRWPEDCPRFGTIALATVCPDVTRTGRLPNGAYFGTGHKFWDAMLNRGEFDGEELSQPTEEGKTAVCALGSRFHLEPGESARVPFLFTWHFPNYEFSQHQWGSEEPTRPRWPAYYTRGFEDAWQVALHVHRNLDRLRTETAKYHRALFGSTLPAAALDAASSQTSTLKTPTCLRLEDGTFYGFEGCSPCTGCCAGSCTHVWNYQQALPFLFPSLERSMRAADYSHNLRQEDGKMAFRIGVPLGTSNWEFHAAADGQLGGMMKTYRDWLLWGDDGWLRDLWPRVKKALAYAWEQWDADRDGVPEGVQHNTYDIELVGPNPLIGAFYLGALRAAEEMAHHLGEHDQAQQYRELFEKGSRKIDTELFNGEYYVQHYDPGKVREQQFGDGCLSDQMLGQWIASVCNLGYLLDAQNVRSALQSVFQYNWRASLADHANPQRVYALGDEAGLLMCSWPRGNRPLIPTMYCDEVWTGSEYQVASHLIMEGFVDEGLAIVQGTRDRHDGERRNPWNEPECGNHYARAMASWGLVLALSGYFYDGRRRLMRFDPRVSRADFRCFWSNGHAWGVYSQSLDEDSIEVELQVLHGRQELDALQLRLDLPDGECAAAAAVDEEEVSVEAITTGEWTVLGFPGAAALPAGTILTVRLPA